MQSIPPFEPLYLSDYIKFWRASYKNAFSFADKAIDPDTAKEHIENIEKTIEAHLLTHYQKLRFIIDDDYFEWNQSMVVFLALCQWRQNLNTPPSAAIMQLSKQWNVLPPLADTLADAILLIKHIDNQWPSWDISDSNLIEEYLRHAHRVISKFINKAGTLRVFNRWDFIGEINKNTFRIHPKGIFFFTAHVSLQLKKLKIGKILHPITTTIPIDIQESDTLHFIKWAETQNTYYNIRTFRQRISFFVWQFLHDEAGRNMHTYSRAGEIPTVYAHVTNKYPSGFIGNMQHDMLYTEGPELIQTNNPLVRDANFLALFEAVVKTLYTFDFIKYCFCNEEAVVEMNRKLMLAEHPILVRCWGKFGVCQKGKFYYTKDILHSLILWLHFVKTDHQCILLKSFNISNLINQVLQINKDFLATESQREEGQENTNVFEVCL